MLWTILIIVISIVIISGSAYIAIREINKGRGIEKKSSK